MSMMSRSLLASALLAACAVAQADTPPVKSLTTQQVLDASKPADWRTLDPQHTLYLDLPAGRVVIELAPTFAPNHVANIEALVKEKYFDGLAILRSQDNFVAQWGDPNAGEKDKEKPIKTAKRTLKAEFTIPWNDKLVWTALPDGDVYAPEVGFINGMHAARDPKAKQAWLTHCYGALGVGRDNDADSGGGTELYVVTGHSPRHLDRNITVVGRVVQGMEWLSSLPRGTGALGFYEKDEQRTPIKSLRLAADVPAAERTELQLLRTDTPTFAALVEARRNRRDEWYKVPAGKIELCNVPLPVRAPPVAAPAKP